MIPEVNPPAARQRSGCFSWQRLTLTSPGRCARLGTISADILAVQKEAEGLLDGLLMGGRRVKEAMERPGCGAAKQAGTAPVPIPAPVATAPAPADEATLLSDLRALVQSDRQPLATVANVTYTLLCWHVGHRLPRENLQTGRAAYGEQILATVSQELTAEFGAGFNHTTLTRMARFSEWVTDEAIVVALSRQSSGSHFRASLAVAGMAIPSERKGATT